MLNGKNFGKAVLKISNPWLEGALDQSLLSHLASYIASPNIT
jgi:hypothetical protein